MNQLILVLRATAFVFLAVGISHLVLGPNAEVLLGANLSEQSINDAVLDSQNRFYGIAFSINAALLLLCTRDMHKYAAVFHIVIWFLFAGGCARLVSIWQTGLPSDAVLFLLLSELLMPPVLSFWYFRVKE